MYVVCVEPDDRDDNVLAFRVEIPTYTERMIPATEFAADDAIDIAIRASIRDPVIC